MTPLTNYGYGSSKETGENHEKKGVGTDNPCKSIWVKAENQAKSNNCKIFAFS